MTTELTKISGIGTNTAKELSEAGFDSIESIAEATPESLSKVKGFGADRGTRVISAAKELTKKSISQKETTEETKEVQETTGGKTETVVAAVAAPVVVSAIKAEDKVENKVATEKKSTKYWNSTVLHPTAAVVLLAFAVIYFGKIDIADNFNSMINNVQTFVSGSSEQQPESEQETTEIVADQNTDSLIDEVNTAQSIAPQPVNQQQITQVPAWVKEQRKNEPQWVKEQRSQADEFRAIQQARSDEFRAAHKAKAEKQMEESWKRYLASLPPAEAKRVAKQKAEMKLRHGS
ncbi:MAG: helix-hairpin-helix domain-containing protein [Gammaproteobacteria bacterium]|nr:helix-hairpin-helix domain-containing protein [Gammaproteobacteria bacterium]